MMSPLCLCGEQAVWRLHPERARKVDLVEALALDAIDLDPMQIVAACTTDLSHAVFCATCADELMDGVSDDMAEDSAAVRAQYLGEFRAFSAEAVLDACIARTYYSTPVLIRL